MKTVLITDLAEAASFIQRGEPVIFPTETVYGLGASALDSKGLTRIFEIKGRPSDNPLIVHISSIDEAIHLSQNLPPEFYLLAEAFWPGPLTLIVEKSPLVPDLVSASHPTIAIRMPSHPIALGLIKALGSPIAAPSANLSGRPSPTTLFDALEDLDGRAAAAIDGGSCPIGIESTVLSLVGNPTLLRPGSITRPMLEAALQQKIALPTSETPILSPGMKYRHYAPKAKVRLVSDPAAYTPSAATLYSLFRNADRRGEGTINIHCTPELLADEALMNRLLRAADLSEMPASSTL